MTATKAAFNWEDPQLLDRQLSGDERAVRDAAQTYARERLAPRVLEAFRNERQRSSLEQQVTRDVVTAHPISHYEPVLSINSNEWSR